jgi:uroporphyrinogen-III decarboxylase
MSGEMSSKERVLTAFARSEPDRVPINYLPNAGIHRRLMGHFGLAAHDHYGLLEALGVDFRVVGAPYAGPKLHEDKPGVLVDDWGVHRKWIEHPSGGYWDYCDFPLKDATREQVEAWRLPDPDDFDYSVVEAQCDAHEDYCVVVGNPGVGDTINSAGMVRTMEQFLLDLALEDPAGMRLVERRHDSLVEQIARTFEAGKGKIDVLWMGEDLGSQIGPMISLDMFRRLIRPHLQRYVDVARSYRVPVMMHCCGSSSWAFDDFLEMGITVVDTLQPEARKMSPEYLKSTYGERLSFHGCISTAGPLAYGSVEEVRASVRETLEIMMPGGGYALSPTHQIQDNSPTENVLAMYETAREHGRY